MPTNDPKIHFRRGDRSDLPNTREDGQLLFATYDDLLHAASGDVTIKQGDIYLDISDGNNGVRINLANDVDKARTLFAPEISTGNSSSGNWSVETEGISMLYDGLVIILKLGAACNIVYNALNINNLGSKLVWYRQGEPLTNQLSYGSELILVYRTQASGISGYSVPNNGPINSLNGTSVTDGWVVAGVTESMHTLTLQGTQNYTYNGGANVTVPLGTFVTLKTWE